MRAFGKFLVYTNLVLSLIFLGWALGLFMQRLDWAPHKSIIKGEINKESGIMYRLEQEVKQLGEASELAERRYLKDADALPQAEEERLAYKKYYKDRLLLGEKGIDSEGKKAK